MRGRCSLRRRIFYIMSRQRTLRIAGRITVRAAQRAVSQTTVHAAVSVCARHSELCHFTRGTVGRVTIQLAAQWGVSMSRGTVLQTAVSAMCARRAGRGSRARLGAAARPPASAARSRPLLRRVLPSLAAIKCVLL